MAVHIHNNVPNAADASSRLEAFTQIAVSPKSSYYHTFGCPAYMFTTEAEQGRAKKWEGRAVLEIYLGPYPHHAGSVSLVLNLTTGNASPQFHVGHDNFSETTRYNRSNARAKSNWKNLSGIYHVDIIDNKEIYAHQILPVALCSCIAPVVSGGIEEIVMPHMELR